MSDQILATVAILTYNGEDYLERILSAIESQEINGVVDILVIDSGSTDSTLDIVRRHPSTRLHEIPNAEFGHGKTRNLAVSLARGEFIAFLTHDAIPASTTWLKEILAPFDLDPSVVAVMGKQVPRATCFPLLAYEIQSVFQGFGPDFGTTVFENGDFITNEGILSAVGFYSDVNSAARREFLATVIPYRDVQYAEDQLFGRDLIVAGYRKAYAPRAIVEHSNDLTLDEYGKRIFDETVGLRDIGTTITRVSRTGALARSLRGSAVDSLRIARDGRYTWRRKLYWLAVNPLFHFRKWFSYSAASSVDIADETTRRRFSLEHSRKSPTS